MSGKLKVLTSVAALSAVSILLVALIHFPILPMVPFLEYDPADIPIFIGTFAFGPLSGLIMTVIVSLIQGFLFGGNGIIGALMHILATGVFAVVAGNIYKRHRTRKGALKATVIGSLVWIVSMALWNILITPGFYGITYEEFFAVYFPFIIIFNVIKVGINCTVTMLLYKRLKNFFEKRIWHT